MNGKVIVGDVARTGLHFAQLLPPSGLEREPRPDGGSVAAAADRANAQPVVSVAAVIAQQRRRAVEIVDKDVQVAVAVVVAERSPTAVVRPRETAPCRH